MYIYTYALVKPDRPLQIPFYRIDKYFTSIVWGRYKKFIIPAVCCLVCILLLVIFFEVILPIITAANAAGG